MDKFKILNAIDGRITFECITKIFNPSKFTGYFGDIYLIQKYNNVELGKIKLTNFEIKKRQNFINTKGFIYLDNNNKILKEFLSNYINNKKSKLNVNGYIGSTTIEPLKIPISNLNYSVILPDSNLDIIKSIKLSILRFKIKLILYNPFEFIKIEILSIKSNAYKDGKLIGSIKESKIEPIIMKPKTTLDTKYLPFKLVNFNLNIIKEYLSKYIIVNITSVCLLKLNNEVVEINYNKNEISIYVTL